MNFAAIKNIIQLRVQIYNTITLPQLFWILFFDNFYN